MLFYQVLHGRDNQADVTPPYNPAALPHPPKYSGNIVQMQLLVYPPFSSKVLSPPVP